jgi:hypothetical protein
LEGSKFPEKFDRKDSPPPFGWVGGRGNVGGCDVGGSWVGGT